MEESGYYAVKFYSEDCDQSWPYNLANGSDRLSMRVCL